MPGLEWDRFASVRAVNAATIAEVEHENFIAALTEVDSAVPGSLIRREHGVVLLASGLPVRLFNEVLIGDASATADGIAAAVAVQRGRHERFVVNLRRGADDRFVGLMSDLGLALPTDHALLPGMALDPIPEGAPRRIGGFEVRAVADASGLEDHIVTAAAGFGLPEEILRAIIAPDLWQRPDRTVYVGYAEGAPVTTGLGVRTGPAIGVYNIATVDSARKRGYGEVMTARIAADARAAGCRVAILQSSPMGFPIYKRLGYRTVVEYDGYIEPEATQVPASAPS